MSDEVSKFFRRLIGKDPFGEYQVTPARLVGQGKPVVLWAPTGSGKSEALLCAFTWSLLQNEGFPQQMVYSLPMRSLVDALARRFADYLTRHTLQVAGHHGGHPGAPLFYSDVVVATIDQVVGAYACTPLSMPVRHGNIPAGAVASAFLIFDEVHTFDPERALQAALILAEHSHRLGLPFAMASATMPDTFIQILQDRFQIEEVKANESDIPPRQNRRVTLRSNLDRLLTPQEVRQAWDRTEGSLLVVVNTVDRARRLFEEVSKTLPDVNVILLHSRFLEKDRSRWEQELEPMFGQHPAERGILIATQIVEVGLDISTRLLLTELSPADSLIQRAGRVARWGGEGEVWVFNVESAAPYEDDVIDDTRRRVRDLNQAVLTWDLERQLVNAVLGQRLAASFTAGNQGRVLFWLAEGAFQGSRRQVEEAVRENLACDVSIHEDPQHLGREVFRLPTVRLDVGILRAFARKQSPDRIWQMFVDEGKTDSIDQRPTVRCEPVRSADAIAPHAFYVLSPHIAAYDPHRGLVLGEAGRAMEPEPTPQKRLPLLGSLRYESWVTHSRNTLQWFYEIFEPRHQAALERLAPLWRLDYQAFRDRIGFAIALHDLGKLTAEWQKGIGHRPSEPPIGHTDDYEARNLPPHATVSAYLLSNLLAEWGRLGDALGYAIAHHHSVRAAQVPGYRLIDEWEEQVTALWGGYPGPGQFWQVELVRPLAIQPAPTTLPSCLPDVADWRTWRTYVIAARLLRLSDRVATGGSEDVLLRYEEWFANV